MWSFMEITFLPRLEFVYEYIMDHIVPELFEASLVTGHFTL